jgi:hypothetical protein
MRDSAWAGRMTPTGRNLPLRLRHTTAPSQSRATLRPGPASRPRARGSRSRRAAGAAGDVLAQRAQRAGGTARSAACGRRGSAAVDTAKVREWAKGQGSTSRTAAASRPMSSSSTRRPQGRSGLGRAPRNRRHLDRRGKRTLRDMSVRSQSGSQRMQAHRGSGLPTALSALDDGARHPPICSAAAARTGLLHPARIWLICAGRLPVTGQPSRRPRRRSCGRQRGNSAQHGNSACARHGITA